MIIHSYLPQRAIRMKTTVPVIIPFNIHVEINIILSLYITALYLTYSLIGHGATTIKVSALLSNLWFGLFSRTGITSEQCCEEDEGCARDGGPDAAVAVVGAAGEDAGAVLLDVAGAGDVLAVVAPVARRAEALRPQLPLEDPSHLDAVVCLSIDSGCAVSNECCSFKLLYKAR